MAENQVTGFNRLNFSSQIGAVANSNEFYATVELPTALQALYPEADQFRRKVNFAIRAAPVPPATVSEIPVNFRSSILRLPGDRDTSGAWDITVRMDVDHVVRDVFEKWNDSLNGHVNNDVIGDFDVDITALFGVGEVHQLSRNGKILKSYWLDGIWPTSVGELSYDWSSANTVVEFPVSLVYQHMESRATRNNVISESAALAGTA